MLHSCKRGVYPPDNVRKLVVYENIFIRWWYRGWTHQQQCTRKAVRWTHRESEAPGKSFNRMHPNNDWHCLHSFYSFPNKLPYYDESKVSSHYPYSFHYCGKVISSVIYPRPTFCRLESWYRPLLFFIKTTFLLLLLQQYSLDPLRKPA